MTRSLAQVSTMEGVVWQMKFLRRDEVSILIACSQLFCNKIIYILVVKTCIYMSYQMRLVQDQ